jgi:hypothetical protein
MMKRTVSLHFALIWAACAIEMFMPAPTHAYYLDIDANTSYTLDSNGQMIFNSGDALDIYGVLENYGWVANYGTTTTYSSGVLNNYSGATLKNDGTLNNYGLLNNNSGGLIKGTGTLNNFGGLYNDSSALLNSGGVLTNYNGMLNSGAAVLNTGTLTNVKVMTNSGTALFNAGVLNNNAGAQLTNNAGSLSASAYMTISDDLGTAFNCSGGTLQNGGTISGTVYSGTLINGGVINGNGAYVQIAGQTTNTGSISQASINIQGGTFVNNGTINGTGAYVQTAGQTTNTGSISQASINIQGGTFNQQAGTLSAGITNSGTFNHTGGTITGNVQNNAPGTFAITPPSGGTLTINGAVTNNSPITGIGQGGFSVNGANFSIIQGNVTITGPVTNNGGGMVVDASGNQYGGFSIHNATVTLNASFTNAPGATFSGINSTLTVAGDVTNQGTWYLDPSTIIFGGNFTNSGTINASGDTFEFASGTHTFNLGGGATTLGTLVLEPGAVLNLTGSGALDVTTLIDPGYSNGSSTDIITDGVALDFTNVENTVPIPGAIWLLIPSLACLVSLRKRFGR